MSNSDIEYGIGDIIGYTWFDIEIDTYNNMCRFHSRQYGDEVQSAKDAIEAQRICDQLNAVGNGDARIESTTSDWVSASVDYSRVLTRVSTPSSFFEDCDDEDDSYSQRMRA